MTKSKNKIDYYSKLEREVKINYIKAKREYEKTIKEYEENIKLIDKRYNELLLKYNKAEKSYETDLKELIEKIYEKLYEDIDKNEIYNEIDAKNLLCDMRACQNDKINKFKISDEMLLNLILKFKYYTYDANLNYWENLESLTNTIVEYLNRERNK